MIRRYYATKDNSITNAYQENLTTRGTGSNMGASDILEVFSIYGQQASTSSELMRTIIQFDTNQIATDRTAGRIPASGSVSWYLKMFNAPHSQTVPSDFNLIVSAVSGAWEEGYGLDMDYYEDLTKDVIGSNWIRRTGSTSWTTAGGDYLTDTSSSFTASFSTGLEDMDLDVTTLVEQWVNSGGNVLGSKDNYGFGIKLPDATETAARSFFTKKFFGRDSEFFFQRPVIEARWDSSRQDDRGAFYASSSLAPAADNLNSLFIHNSIRGRLQNIPTLGSNDIYVNLYDSLGGTKLAGAFTGSSPSTGIYKCDVFLETTASTIHDVWFSGSNEYHSGTISVKTFASTAYNPESAYVLSMPRLSKEYRKDQTHRLDLYAREKNWSPNIYTVAIQASIPSLIIPSASFQVRRSIDDFVVVPYGTGSATVAAHTALSYDVSGSYFDLDTTYLEAGYLYEIQYSFYDEENGWEEQPYRFKFRVVD